MTITKFFEKALPYVIGAVVGEGTIMGISVVKRKKENRMLKDITEKGNVITGIKLSRWGLTRTYICEGTKKEEEKNA